MKGETEWPARAGFKELDFVHHSDTFLSFSSNLWVQACRVAVHFVQSFYDQPGQTHKLVGTYSHKRMWMEPQACAAWSRSDWHSVTMRLPTFFYNKYLSYEETKNACAAAECRSWNDWPLVTAPRICLLISCPSPINSRSDRKRQRDLWFMGADRKRYLFLSVSAQFLVSRNHIIKYKELRNLLIPRTRKKERTLSHFSLFFFYNVWPQSMIDRFAAVGPDLYKKKKKKRKVNERCHEAAIGWSFGLTFSHFVSHLS